MQVLILTPLIQAEKPGETLLLIIWLSFTSHFLDLSGGGDPPKKSFAESRVVLFGLNQKDLEYTGTLH